MERLINMASFAEVVEAGGFSAAADRLGCSRAVVSKRISALEKDFGLTLLHRTTRRQSLTEAGEALYAYCRRVLDEMNSAEAHLQELSSTPRGTLRITAPHSWGNRVLGPQIGRFLLRYPEIRVELQLSDQLADLAASAVDIAIRLTNTPAPGLVARHLAELPYVICAAPAYLKTHGIPLQAQELARHNCIFYAGEVRLNNWQLRTPQGELLALEVAGSLAVNSVEVMRSAALEGLGIVALSRYLVDAELQRGELIEVLADCQMPPRQIHLVTLPDRLLPAKTRAFIDFLLPGRLA
ncbi:LysR family transcriptional regulator [Uliginosibacterium aquaticum]|uniref:LysR family transcriptional regulator n=1 Tax=Uliginosibacterium aquaticum TaxID=2731212 RepID=A0ABX2IHC2_9RHOO|nr:LysR family transcriptional regulator [Uliginosibacterium aquaticum]NSL55892.1 LysR family transcriptional regulator [Uliginosibacterium aquaticum]